MQSPARREGLLRKLSFEMEQELGEAEGTRKLALCCVQLVSCRAQDPESLRPS